MSYFKITETPSDESIDQISTFLRQERVVVLPTDTLYGQHGLAGSATATDPIVATKRRDADKPLIVLCSSTAQLESLGVETGPRLLALLAELWPAPLTVILPLRRPIAASRGALTLAVRIPDLIWLRRLIDRTGPVSSTSVNESGEQPVVSVDALPERIRSAVAAVVDAGSLEGKASTILDCTRDPRVLREGAFDFTQDLWKKVLKAL